MSDKRVRVLVVDDLSDWRMTLSDLFEYMGYAVHTASSRQAALRIVDVEHFDVAILDVRLDAFEPDNRDGLLLMHEIKEKNPTTEVIILSGYADKDMVREALQPDERGIRPAFCFLQKGNSDISRLPEYVRRAVEHESPFFG